MKILTEKEKGEIKFLDTAIAGFDKELTKHRDFIKALLAQKQSLLDIKKRLVKG